ncbi:MAG: T9SS type A sorting domain-containing protein [Tunicatimonas sp.]
MKQVYFRNILRSALFLTATLGIANAYVAAQSVRLIPLSASSEQSPNARQQAFDTVLTLPFWDDFSQPITDVAGFTIPDTLHWQSPSRPSVLVNTGLGIAPPSVGIASFDGVDARGAAYDTAASRSALSDQLVSHPINLALVPEAERNSVFLSFFWQPQGRGELPESGGDSLRLQFKTADTTWVTVWSQMGGESLVTDVFTQEVLAVSNLAYFHERFQFRFQSFSRPSAAFDTWNVDYVYLNQGRSANDLAYPDAAITSLPTSPFGEYTQVPMKQFRADPSRYLSGSSVQYYNLRSQPVGTTFEAFLNDALSGQMLYRLSDSANALSPLPTAFDRRTIAVGAPVAEAFDLTQDSLFIQSEFYIETGDQPRVASIGAEGDTTFNLSVDYRDNDTVRTTFVINETLAYDDGTAEFGLELNQTGGRVAYQFVVPEEDLLTDVEIHFPNLAENQDTRFRLLVWKSLTDTARGEVVLRESDVLLTRRASRNNQFITYQLESPVAVRDTFYVGYQQESTDQFLIVGYDKNTDTKERIFYSVSNDWVQSNDLQGSLMIRPRFDRERAQLVTDLPGEEVSPPANLTVFPNPTTGLVRVQGTYEQLRVVDLLGREVPIIPRPDSTVDLSPYPAGIYVFQFTTGTQTVTKKVIRRP